MSPEKNDESRMKSLGRQEEVQAGCAVSSAVGVIAQERFPQTGEEAREQPGRWPARAVQGLIENPVWWK